MKTDRSDQTITLFFHQEEIASAFGELLHSMGFETTSIRSEDDLRAGSKLITEPLYYDDLCEELQQNCLVIGHGHQLTTIPGPVISRPLTPAKIERGLKAFLDLQPVH